MLLGNRKKQDEEQNWCIVLTPLRNEIDKKKVSRKISEVFSLSLEEALDLVSNTPIILLDNLPRNTALKIKDYFRSEGADLVLSNDIFYKRKCYRTVWPEAPNLAFLNDWNGAVSKNDGLISAGSQAINADEALEEIRSLRAPGPSTAEKNEVTAPGSFSEEESGISEREKKKLLEELEMWRRECAVRRSEVEKLQSALAKIQDTQSAARTPKPGTDAFAREKENQSREQQALLKNLQEKYDALREEYKQARLFFEDKVASTSRENQEARGKLKSLEDKAQALHEKNQILQSAFDKTAAELKVVQNQQAAENQTRDGRLSETASALQQAKEKAVLLEAEVKKLKEKQDVLEDSLRDRESAIEKSRHELIELERFKSNAADMENRLQSYVEQRAQLELRLTEMENRHQKIEEAWKVKLTEVSERRDLFELRLTDAEKELQSSTRRIHELTDELKRMTDSKKNLVTELEERKRIEEQERLQTETLIKKYNAIIMQYDENKLLLLKSEQSLNDLRAEFERVSTLSEHQVKRSSALETRCKELEMSFAALEAKIESQRQQLEAKTLEVSEKSRELEVSSIERDSLKRALQEHSQRADAAEARLEEQSRHIQNIEETALRFERAFQDKAKHLEAREREIENLRRQVRDINFQMEQRETLLKRNQVMAQLSEKEERLKRLVDDQSRMEAEIRQREEMMRQILSQQEMLEKEIVEGKQAQRHLLEQVKKEKTLPSRASKTDAPAAISASPVKKENNPA